MLGRSTTEDKAVMGGEDEDDIDLTDEQIAALSKQPDPAPPEVQAEFAKQLDQYELDVRQALTEKFK